MKMILLSPEDAHMCVMLAQCFEGQAAYFEYLLTWEEDRLEELMAKRRAYAALQEFYLETLNVQGEEVLALLEIGQILLGVARSHDQAHDLGDTDGDA
jgi:hypothetical protein